MAAAIVGQADGILTDDAALRIECEESDICDVMGVGEFLAYTIAVSPQEAAAALRGMLEGWPEAEDHPANETWERFLAWLGKRGWASAADILRTVSEEDESGTPGGP